MLTTCGRIFVLGVAALCVLVLTTRRATAGDSEDLSGKHVLVIPLAGSTPDAATLSASINASVAATGATAVSAKVRKSDITAITGCESDSTDCYDQIADTLGVDHIVFGKIASSSTGDVVSLTIVGDGHTRTGEIQLERGASRISAFRGATKRFLLGTPELTNAPVRDAAGASATPDSSYALSRVKPRTWKILGGGAAAMGTGVIFLLLARSKQADVNSAPTQTAADLDRLADLEGSGKALTTWGNVFLIGGGAATIVGAVLATREARQRPESRQVSITPVATKGGLGLTLGGRF